MPQEDLTEGQKELYNNLMNEIEKGGDDSIFPILKKASQKDFLAVLNTTNIINLQDGREFALTMLNYCAISLDPEEITKVILDVAKKDKEVLKEVLNTPNGFVA